MSDSDQDSFLNNVVIDSNIESTIKFCENCNNMLQPTAEDECLKYKCNKPNCEFQMEITSKNKTDNLVSRIVNQKERNLIIDKEFCMDPTMPRRKIICPQCQHNEAAFLITSDKEDTKIELYYICCSPDCDYFWKNKEPDQINFQTKIFLIILVHKKQRINQTKFQKQKQSLIHKFNLVITQTKKVKN